MKNMVWKTGAVLLLVLSAWILSARDFEWSCTMNDSELVVALSAAKGFYLYDSSTKAALFSAHGEIRPSAVPAGKDGMYQGTVRWVFPIEKQQFPLTLKAAWQGCSKDGVCFLPEEKEHVFHSFEEGKPLVLFAGSETAPQEIPKPGFEIIRTASGYLGKDAFLAFLKGEEGGTSFHFADRSFLLVLLLVLLGGIALNLTPCVLPMIPVNLAIIGADAGREDRLGATVRGLVYGLGIALAYGGLGLFVVLTGSAFGVLDSTWWFNGIAALIFLLLGLSMFDLFQIDLSRYGANFRIPSGMRLAGIFAMGILAAVLAGACVAPVVAATLLQASKMYNSGEHTGLILPFALGIGMGLPWPLAAAGFAVLPKPGAWMKYVKCAFGVLILGLGLYYAYTGYRIFRLSASGNDAVRSISALSAALKDSARTQQPVFIDFRAEWCKNCKAMERTTLRDPAVQAELKKFISVDFDATDMSDRAVRDTLKQFGISGLPAYVIARGK